MPLWWNISFIYTNPYHVHMCTTVHPSHIQRSTDVSPSISITYQSPRGIYLISPAEWQTHIRLRGRRLIDMIYPSPTSTKRKRKRSANISSHMYFRESFHHLIMERTAEAQPPTWKFWKATHTILVVSTMLYFLVKYLSSVRIYLWQYPESS